MASTFGPAAFLLAALAVHTTADSVTTAPCESHCTVQRQRTYPLDTEATWICLNRCVLTQVSPQDLTGLPNVNDVDLSHNDIARLDTDVFRSVPKLSKLHLNSNKLTVLPVFVEHSCPRLSDLFLDKNLITEISNASTFAACNKLRGLSLSDNRIEYLHPDVFSQLTDLRRLFLEGNRLSSVSSEMFLNTKLNWLELQENRFTYLPTNFVTKLKESGVVLETFYFGRNPWDCRCLSELLDEVKRVGVSDYTADWDFDGTREECTNNTAVACVRNDTLRN